VIIPPGITAGSGVWLWHDDGMTGAGPAVLTWDGARWVGMALDLRPGDELPRGWNSCPAHPVTGTPADPVALGLYLSRGDR
jgi:hypothetical protein